MILVTGAGGLVGSHLVTQLVREGKKVRALYRSAIPDLPVKDLVEWIQGDILDVEALSAAMAGISQVYHCAAMVSFNPRKKKLMHHTNIEGTANVVNACLEESVNKLLFVSSVAALGRIRENAVIDETMNWTEESSNSEYGKSKYLSEIEVWRGIGEGLQAVIVNPVIILGAADWHSGSSGIFKSAYEEFPWYTQGVSGFVDVQDVVKAMILLMDNDIHSERFILSEGDHAYQEVFSLIAKAFQKNPPHRKVTPLLSALVWRWEAVKAYFTGKDPLLTKETAKTAMAKVAFDNSKIKKAFPAFAYTPLSDSIDRICSEYRDKYSLA